MRAICIPQSRLTGCLSLQELRAHQCVLAACSEYFKRLFCGPETAKRIEFQQRWPVVHQLVRCMYGADIEGGTDPEIILEVQQALRIYASADLSRLVSIRLATRHCFAPTYCKEEIRKLG